jgi:hypothetical protein
MRIRRLDPNNVPGHELESYDFKELFEEIEATKPFPDIPVVVVRRGKSG